ncbi:MAG: DUF4166 domain-containing protein [Gammaproteobacteria bacterium]|nr:DUF4166 domain-containing protein [Gammaproteobacteria bacterium]
MKSLMQHALGDEWSKLPPALQAHYRFGTTTDAGHMDIEYPRVMQLYLNALHLLGGLVNRRGLQVPTLVEKHVIKEKQYWRRTITYPDGKVIKFNSFWVPAGKNQVIEYINPILGLAMAAQVREGQLYYHGIKFVVKLGSILIPVPEWLVLGHTTIVEKAVGETRFAMDFRITHPLFGQVFRYSGEFESAAQ